MSDAGATFYPVTVPRARTVARIPTVVPAMRRTSAPPPTPPPTTVGPLTAAAMAEHDRLFGDVIKKPDSFGTIPGLNYGPVSATGYLGGVKDAKSTWEQFTGTLPAIAGGVVQTVAQAADTIAGVPRLGLDLLRGRVPNQVDSPEGAGVAEHTIAGINEYFPLWGSMGASAYTTANRLANPIDEYRRASREGNVVGAIVEDIANVALAGSGVAKIAGRVPLTVEVAAGEGAASEAAAVAGSTRLASVGAQPLTVAQALRPVAPTTMGERSLLARLSEVAPAAERQLVELPGRGLAGLAHARGYTGAAERIGQIGDVTRRYSHLGERATDPAGIFTFAPRQANRAVTALTGRGIPSLTRSGVGGTVERLGGSEWGPAIREGQVIEKLGARGGIFFPLTEQGRQFNQIKSIVERTMTEVQRATIVPARLAAQLGLTDPAARAALFLVDEMMFPTVQTFRQYGDRLTDAQKQAIVERMYVDPYTGKPVDRSMRPHVEDVEVLVDYAEGRLDPALKQKIDDVATAMGRRAEDRTTALLAERKIEYLADGTPVEGAPLLDPNQVGTELLPDVVTREQRRPEMQRERLLRQQQKQHARVVKSGLVATAHDLLASELPEPPRVGPIYEQGVRAGRVLQNAASRYDTAARDLAAAVDDYLSEELPTARVAEAERRVARLTARVAELRSEYDRMVRREQAAGALSGVSGEVEAIPGVTRPAVDVAKAGSVGELRTRAKAIGDEEARQVFGEIENMVGNERLAPPPRPGARGEPAPQLMGEEAIAARREAPRGEWDWWTEQQLSAGTRKRLVREGWVSGRTRGSITTRYRDPVTGEIKTRRHTGEAANVGVGPAELTRIINEQLNRNLSIDDAMALYVEAVERLWAAESGTSIPVLERLAVEQSIPFEAAVQAVRGRLSDYAEALSDPINRDIDRLRTAYLEMSPEERQSHDLTVDAVLADPDAAGDFGVEDVLQDDFPDLNITGTGGIIETFANTVSMDDLIAYIRTGEQTAEMKAVRARRTPAQHRQLGRLAGQRYGLGQLVTETAGEQRAAQRALAAANREARRNVEAAGKAVDNAAEVEAGRRAALTETEGLHVPPERVRAFERPPRRLPEGAAGPPVPGRADRLRRSPAETLQMRRGAAIQRHNDEVIREARLERSIAYRNEKIGNMRSELSRGFVERMVTDINRPAITNFRNIVRKAAPPLGRLRGRRGNRYLDGVLGRLSTDYGFHDELVARLDQIEAQRRSPLRVVNETFGDEYPESSAQLHASVFDEVAAENGVTLDRTDAQAYADSVATDTLLEEMAMRATADAGRGLTPNTPFRLRELIDDGLRSLPDDIKSQFAVAWDRYNKRRSNHLNRVFDRYSEAIPAPYRAPAMTARRQIRVLLEQAEEMNRAKPGSGDMHIHMATATMDTLAEYVEEGVEPTHLIGGPDVLHPFSGRPSSGWMQARKMRAEKQRRHGLRALSPAAQARVEADQLATVLHNRQRQAIIAPIENGGFGRRADFVLRDEIARHFAETGERMSPQQMTEAATDAGWVSTERGGAVNEQSMLIPKAIAKNMNDYGFTQNIAWQFLRSANRMWKSWVLPLSTKWLTGNMFGNAISAAAYAGVNPITLLRTMREIKRMSPGDLWARGGLPAWAPDALASHGLGWRDFQTMFDVDPSKAPPGGIAPVRGFRKGLRWTIENSYQLNEVTDNLTRSAVYLVKLRDGVPSATAMKVALNALGDFTRMSRFERRFLKEIIPFYAWLRHQTQATLRLPIESPARAAWLLHLADLYSDTEENGDLMRLIGSAIPLGGGRFLDIGSISPFAEVDPFQTPFSPTGIGRAVSPMFRLPIALTTGLDVARMQQITRPASTTRRGPYGQEEATPPLLQLLRGRPLQALGEVGYVASQQLAPTQIRSLRDLALGPNARYGAGYEIGSETGRYLPAQRGSVLNQLARVAGIPSVRTIDLAEARRRAREQERRQRG